MCVPLEGGFQRSRARAWPALHCQGAGGGKARGDINYQSQTVQANGHDDINFSRLHHQQTLPDPSLRMTRRLSRWHPGFPHAGWKLPQTADLCLPYLFQKQTPGLLFARQSCVVAMGLIPSRGPAWYSSTFRALTYPCPDGALGGREGPGAALAPTGSTGSPRQTALCSPNPYQTKVDVCKADASVGGLCIGCARASHRNAPLGCNHGQIRPQDFAFVHLT